MNPDEFHRLVDLDKALTEAVFERPELSELALKAHAAEDTPGQAIESPTEMKALLDL